MAAPERSKVMAAPEHGEYLPHGHPTNTVCTVSSTNGPVCHPAVADISKEPAGNVAEWLSVCLGKDRLERFKEGIRHARFLLLELRSIRPLHGWPCLAAAPVASACSFTLSTTN